MCATRTLFWRSTLQPRQPQLCTTPPSHLAMMWSRSAGLRVLAAVVVAVISLSLVSADDAKTPQREGDKGAAAPAPVPEPRQLGGEPDGIVQVANLVYAGTKSSQCFSDHFLIQAEKESSISTSRRFHATKLGSEEVFGFPLVIMTGEGEFSLTDQERENLRQYVQGGGLLLASAGCSSREWDRSFRREMAHIFPATAMQPLGLDHQVFHTVYDIKVLEAKHGKPRRSTASCRAAGWASCIRKTALTTPPTRTAAAVAEETRSRTVRKSTSIYWLMH